MKLSCVEIYFFLKEKGQHYGLPLYDQDNLLTVCLALLRMFVMNNGKPGLKTFNLWVVIRRQYHCPLHHFRYMARHL
jgi:hypothetical protein